MAVKQANKQDVAQTISFKAKLVTIGSWTILKLPANASAKLSSRGQVMVEGLFNSEKLQTALEPDGNWGHWFRPSDKLLKAANVKAGDTVTLSVKQVKTWPEPDVPAEWQQALKVHPKANDLWKRITPMARWEWIRWARATNNAETYTKRIEVGCSKLTSGERRPCCWNRNLCTEPTVSKNGVLLDPTS